MKTEKNGDTVLGLPSMVALREAKAKLDGLETAVGEDLSDLGVGDEMFIANCVYNARVSIDTLATGIRVLKKRSLEA